MYNQNRANFSRFGVSDFLIGITGAIIALTGLKLSIDLESPLIEKIDLKPVAQIKSGVGKRKTQRSISWESLSGTKTIYNNDQIFTNNTNKIDLEFNDKTLLKIDKNTLIKINYGPKEFNIDLNKGNIAIHINKSQSFSTSDLGPSKIHAKKGSVIELSKVAGAVSVQLKKGRATIGPQENSRPIPKEAIFIQNNKILKKKATDIVKVDTIDKSLHRVTKISKEHATLKTIYISKISNPSKVIGLNIKEGSLPLYKIKPGRYLISTDKKQLIFDKLEITQSNKNLINKEKTSFSYFNNNHYTSIKFDRIINTNHSVGLFSREEGKEVPNANLSNGVIKFKNLMPDAYELKIKDKSNNHVLHTSTLEVPSRIEARPSSSYTKKKLLFTKLNWDYLSKEDSELFKVSITNSKNKIVTTANVNDKTYTFQTKNPGKYRLSITPLSRPELQFNKGFSVQLPKLKTSTVQASQVMNYSSKNKCHIIKLNKVENAAFYYLEIYKDKNLKNLLLNKWLLQPEYCWRSYYDGEYYIRSKNIDHWNRSSDFSTPGKVIFPISPLTDF